MTSSFARRLRRHAARLLVVGALLGGAAAVRADVTPEVAIARLDAQLATAPHDVARLAERARLRAELGQFERAMADLDLAAALAPRVAALRVARARIFVAMAQPDAAIAELDLALALEDSFGARALRAALLEREGRYAEALDDYDVALGHADAIDLHLGRARVLRRLDRLEVAAAELRRAVVRMRGAVTLRLALIEILDELGRHEEALAQIDAARAGLRVQTRWLLRRARQLEALGRPDEARQEREHAVQQAEARLRRRPSQGAADDLAAARAELGR